MIMTKPQKVKNDCTGACDNCGNELGAFKWRLGESTGCTKKCVESDCARDFADDEANYELDAPTCSMSGSERGGQ